MNLFIWAAMPAILCTSVLGGFDVKESTQLFFWGWYVHCSLSISSVLLYFGVSMSRKVLNFSNEGKMHTLVFLSPFCLAHRCFSIRRPPLYPAAAYHGWVSYSPSCRFSTTSSSSRPWFSMWGISQRYCLYIYFSSCTYFFIGTEIEVIWAYGTTMGQCIVPLSAVGKDDSEEVPAVRVDVHLVVPWWQVDCPKQHTISLWYPHHSSYPNIVYPVIFKILG